MKNTTKTQRKYKNFTLVTHKNFDWYTTYVFKTKYENDKIIYKHDATLKRDAIALCILEIDNNSKD